MSDLVEMTLKKLTYCPRTYLPILILESVDGSSFMPVLVSYPEWELLTHKDFGNLWYGPALWPLVKGLLVAFQADIREITIEQEETRFAGQIVIDSVYGMRIVNTRAGEAIAVAERCGAPIRMRCDRLLKRGSHPDPQCGEGDPERFGCLAGATK